MRAIVCLACLFLLSDLFGETPAKVSFQSKYTEADSCRWGEEITGEKPIGDDYRVCAGVGGYVLFESYSADATYKSIEKENSEFETSLSPLNGCSVYSYGAKVEWRLANGKPFAVIYRAQCNGEMDEDGKRTAPEAEYLMVRGLEGYTFDHDVNVKTPKANEVARKYADSAYLAASRKKGR